MKFVIGYASLLSEISISRLFPNVREITQVKLFGYARCFNSYGTLSVDKGLVNANDKCISHASAIIHPNATMYALAFQLDEKDFNTFKKHEFRYVFDEVKAHVRNSKEVFDAIMCFEGLDSKIKLPHMNYLDIQSLMDHYGVKTFWNRNDFPAEVYLKHCIAAAKSISTEYLNNFLDTSYLNDRKVTLREYLETTKNCIGSYIDEACISEIF
jgi:hypothetical protein